MKVNIWLLIGAGIGAWILLDSKPASAAPKRMSGALILQAGERYQLEQLAPVAGAPVMTAEQGQAFFDQILPGAVHIVSITPASGSNPTVLIFDVLRTLPFTVPPTSPITDLGPTPRF
jgi:hypothetical protein